MIVVDRPAPAPKLPRPVQQVNLEAILPGQPSSFDTSCRGFACRFHVGMLEQTSPGAFLGDSTIRLELLRGIPADCEVTEAQSVGWWLSTQTGGKILLVDTEHYSSGYSNPRQTQRVFAAVMEADHALFICHEVDHFVAGFIIRPQEALLRRGERKFQPLVVVTDSLQISASAISRQHSRRLLAGLQTAFNVPGQAEAEFQVVNLVGPQQQSATGGAGADCGIFTYLALLRFLDRPDIFDVAPGQTVSDASRLRVRTWISNQETHNIRLRLHEEYKFFWQHKPSVIWSSRPNEDLRRLLRDPAWPSLIKPMLDRLDSKSSRNNLLTVYGRFGGYFSPASLASFLAPGEQVVDTFFTPLLRRHPDFPDLIAASVPFEIGDYNLASRGQQKQSGEPLFVPTDDRQDVLGRIVRAATEKTEILFIPIFNVSGHYWSVWLDLKRQVIFFSDSLGLNRFSEVEGIRAELASVLPLSRVDSFRNASLQNWPIQRVQVTLQVSFECFICVVEMFRSLSVPFRPTPPLQLRHERGWDGPVRARLFHELFSN